MHGQAPEEKRRAGERPGDKLGTETVAASHLRSFVERMERLAEEKEVIKDDEKAVMAEAKAMGFDNKAIRNILRIRKKDPQKLAEELSILDIYLVALGMDEGLR
ncbi:DUF2312 domain-containing protein [Rhizobium sp. RM]|uniref:DUF2312 domain-containing protein n=1 Tax=Rhizobium sp. RM TaxID=2748079 RepID=UPI0033654984